MKTAFYEIMKAVLVIDIPEDYTGSVISVNLYGRNNKLIHENHINKLRPLPHKLQADWYTDGYKEGFNACLDEITECITQKKDT